MNFDDVITSASSAPEAPAKPQPKKRSAIPIAGLPTVSLLPPEIRFAARGRVLRRGMVGLVLVAVVATAGGAALSSSVQQAADQRLADTTAQTARLQQSVGKFADVQRLQSSVQLGAAAVTVGSSTTIDWNAQLNDVLASMPYGYTVSAISADSASAVADYPQGTDPLEKPRAATVQLTVKAPTITPLSPWLLQLRSIPAYADATSSYTRADTGGYTAIIVLHLNSKAIVKQGAAQ